MWKGRETGSRSGKKCNMKYLDADVKRLLASVSAIVLERNTVVSDRGIEDRELEHWPDDSHEQEARRVCGTVGPRRAEHEWFSGGQCEPKCDINSRTL